MTVGSIDGENIECLTDHLSSFTMVVLDAEVYCGVITEIIHKHTYIFTILIIWFRYLSISLFFL